MAYALIADINALTASLLTITSSTVPTQAQTEAWIDQYGAMLDAALTDAGYATIPLSNANDLLIAKKMVAEATALKALTVFFNWQVPDAVANFLGGNGAFDAWLDKIRSGDFTFVSEQGSAGLVTVTRSEQLGATDYRARYPYTYSRYWGYN